MGIISKPRSHPAMVRSMLSYMALRDRTEIDIREFRQVIASAPVVQSAKEEPPEPDLDWKEDGSMWRDSLDVAVEPGILRRDGERVPLIESTLAATTASDRDFRTALRRQVL